MKKVTSLFLVLLFSVSAFAQSGIKHLQYSISVSSDNPQMQSMESMFSGSKMDMYYNGTVTRTDMVMGSMMKTTTIANYKDHKILILMDGMTRKLAMTPSMDQIKAEKDKVNYKVQLADGTKKIAGYECHKAILTISVDSTNMGTIKMTIWYTKDIDMGDLSSFSFGYNKVPGVPMEFDMKKGPMTMNFIATQYEATMADAVDPNMFSMAVPTGYKLVSMDDLKNMGH